MSVSIQNVSQYFGDQAALNEVSLEVPSSQVLGLLGPNGAGKSTFDAANHRLHVSNQGQGPCVWNGRGVATIGYETSCGLFARTQSGTSGYVHSGVPGLCSPVGTAFPIVQIGYAKSFIRLV